MFKRIALITLLATTVPAHAQTAFEVSGLTLGVDRQTAYASLDERWQDAKVDGKAYVITPAGRTKRIERNRGNDLSQYLASSPPEGKFALIIDKLSLGRETLFLSFSGDLILIGVTQRLPQLSEDQILPLYGRYFDRYGAPLKWRSVFPERKPFDDKSLFNGARINGRPAGSSYALDEDCQSEYDSFQRAKSWADKAEAKSESKVRKAERDQQLQVLLSCLDTSDDRWRFERSPDAILSRLEGQELIPQRQFVWNCSEEMDDITFATVIEQTPNNQFGWPMDKAINALLERKTITPALCILRAGGTEISMGLFDAALFTGSRIEINQVDF